MLRMLGSFIDSRTEIVHGQRCFQQLVTDNDTINVCICKAKMQVHGIMTGFFFVVIIILQYVCQDFEIQSRVLFNTTLFKCRYMGIYCYRSGSFMCTKLN